MLTRTATVIVVAVVVVAGVRVVTAIRVAEAITTITATATATATAIAIVTAVAVITTATVITAVTAALTMRKEGVGTAQAAIQVTSTATRRECRTTKGRNDIKTEILDQRFHENRLPCLTDTADQR